MVLMNFLDKKIFFLQVAIVLTCFQSEKSQYNHDLMQRFLLKRFTKLVKINLRGSKAKNSHLSNSLFSLCLNLDQSHILHLVKTFRIKIFKKSIENCHESCNNKRIISSDLKPGVDASLKITRRKVIITYGITKSYQLKIFGSLVLKLQNTETETLKTHYIHVYKVLEVLTSIATSDIDKANVLGDFFSSVFTTELENCDPIGTKCDEQSSDAKFHEEEVRKLLRDLNVNKSPEPDLVHPRVLYKLSDTLSKPLCMIFNSAYDSGIVPGSWKIGQITALFKKGKKNLAANYRPVSLTSIICKVMEKLVRKKIVDHMTEYSLFSRQQFGFIKGRSTTLQLLKVLDSWTEIIDQGGQLDVVYMDFMKAFDKVPHQRLLMKLKSYGLSDKT